jgi:Rrf2 family protein
MISLTSQYAFHILSILAKRPDRPMGTAELAAATGIPANYLSKVTGKLRKGGLLNTRRGWHGGCAIRPEALDWPLREVVKVIEGDARPSLWGCALGLPACDADRPCSLHTHWSDIRTSFDRMLQEILVRDLAGVRPRTAEIDLGQIEVFSKDKNMR